MINKSYCMLGKFNACAFFKKKRNALTAAIIITLAALAWMAFGAGQRAEDYSRQLDIRAQKYPLSAFMAAISHKQFNNSTLYIRADKTAVVIGDNGPSAIISDFGASVSENDLSFIKNHGVEVKGAMSIQIMPALASPAQATAAAISDTIAKFGSSLLSLGFTVFFMFYIYNMASSGSGPFGGKKYKLYNAASGDTAPVLLSDVAGMTGPKQELAEVVYYLKDPRSFVNIGARPPRGVLLYGPPGNGKTLLAKAIAGEAGVPFIEQNASTFVNMFVGAGAAGARALFKTARQLSKDSGGCVVFIDEIDAVGGSRNGGHDERLQTLNGLLAEMDGFTDNAGIVVVAATNRLESLDTALLRPGRFDRKVYVPLPGTSARAEILDVYLKQIKTTDGISSSDLAKMGAYMSGADLSNWVNEAAIEAVRSGSSHVEMHHFMLARDRILVGPENHGIELSSEEESAVAYHEAGHAVTRWALGGYVDRVTIVPRGMALGVTFTTPDENTRFTSDNLATEIAVLVAGRAAEELFTGYVSSGASSDIERASRMAYEGVSTMGLGTKSLFTPQTDAGRANAEKEARSMVEDAYARVIKLLGNVHQDQVTHLRDRLMVEKIVTSPFQKQVSGA